MKSRNLQMQSCYKIGDRIYLSLEIGIELQKWSEA